MKASNKLLLLLMFLLTLVLVSACASSDNTKSDEDVNGEGDENSGESEDDKETYTLKMTSTFPTPTTDENEARTGKALSTEIFADEVEEKTDGQVEVEIYYSNQLVPQDQALDATESGTVDMVNSSAYWGDTLPTQDFVFLPFAFSNPDHFLHVMRETEAGDIFEEDMEEKGAKILMYWSSGSQGIMSRDPVESLDDLKGMTIRNPVGMWSDWYAEIDAAPANVDAAEQYESLSRGVIDSTIYAYYTIDSYKFHEVTKHITTPPIMSPLMAMNFISMEKWEEIPSDLQDTIMDVSLELEEEAMDAVEKVDEEALEVAEENGVTIHELSDDELQKFEDSTDIIYEQFADRNEKTAKMVEILEESQEEFE